MSEPRVPAWIELAGDNVALATAELEGALAALGGSRAEPASARGPPEWLLVHLPSEAAIGDLAGRLALSRRVLRPVATGSVVTVRAAAKAMGARGGTAAFRPRRGGRSPLAEGDEQSIGKAYTEGGGRIDLANPDHRFILDGGPTAWRLAEEVRADTPAPERRMPSLPFQRPVSLSPRLGRVAANLAQIRPGDRVVDPFVGTGALLIEAALLGARVSGVDRDPAMVRGALENLAHLGIQPDELRIGDAGEAFGPTGGGGWDAVLTDPPYGRSSGSAGEDPAALVQRVLPRWAEHVRPGGSVVVVMPGGPDPLPSGWVSVVRVPDRVHRSLTREFCVYRRSASSR